MYLSVFLFLPPSLPFLSLSFPFQEALKLVLTIKGFGNECFRRGENYDALWKYEHALLLCYTYPHQLSSEKAALHSNIAAVCLKMGDSRDESLLDPQQFPPSHVLWYAFTQQHSSEAIALAPEAKILHKVYIVNNYRDAIEWSLALNVL